MFDNNFYLSKSNLVLKPLEHHDLEKLTVLASDPRIWVYAPYSYHDPLIFKTKWFDKIMTSKRLALGIWVNNQLAGSTSYYDIDTENKTLNIGYTWLHPDYWGSKVNVLSKLLLITHAIEVLNFSRVGFCVDSINMPSRKAIEKIGATYEGTLRNHLILNNGRVRHSAIYSIIAEEWPVVKKGIESLIDFFHPL